MIALGAVVSLACFVPIFLVLLSTKKKSAHESYRSYGGARRYDPEDVPFGERIATFLLLVLYLAGLLTQLVPFETRCGLLLFPISIHALRDTFLPWNGEICFLAMTALWSVPIYLAYFRSMPIILTRDRYILHRNVVLYSSPVLVGVLLLSWTGHWIANSRSFPEAAIHHSKHLSPAEALARAPTFWHASDRIILDEAFRQSEDANDRIRLLNGLTEYVRKGKGGLPALQAVIDGAREFAPRSDSFDQNAVVDALSVVASRASTLGTQEGLATLQAVIAVGKQIEDLDDRSSVLRTCAVSAAQLKRLDLALMCLTDVAAAAKEIRNAADRSSFLRDCASTVGEIKQRDFVLKCLVDAVAAARKIEDLGERFDALHACREVANDLDISPEDVRLPPHWTHPIRKTLSGSSDLK